VLDIRQKMSQTAVARCVHYTQCAHIKKESEEMKKLKFIIKENNKEKKEVIHHFVSERNAALWVKHSFCRGIGCNDSSCQFSSEEASCKEMLGFCTEDILEVIDITEKAKPEKSKKKEKLIQCECCEKLITEKQHYSAGGLCRICDLEGDVEELEGKNTQLRESLKFAIRALELDEENENLCSPLMRILYADAYEYEA
jgi:hypothetical protein